MYLIEEGKAYLIDGEVGYLANFDKDGKMLIDKKETIDTKGKEVYTYDEMYAKLNIAYRINELKKENALNGIENEVIDELNKKVADLTRENEELKSLLAEKEVEPEKEEETTDEPTEPEKEEEGETNEEEKPVEEETKENKKNK